MENIILTGFRDLDYMLKGLRESELIFIGGRPCTGKSTLALNIARNVTEHQKNPVLFISLEESISIDDLITKSRAHKEADRIGLIIIDYLQLLRDEGFETIQLEMSMITQKLKKLALELSIPIIVFSQLPRVVENRDDHRPMLQDLRYIGAIEQDLDRVIFLYRDDFYNKDTECKGITEIIVAKNYRGDVGTIELAFNPAFNSTLSRFENVKEIVIEIESRGIQFEKDILKSYLTQGYDLMEEKLIDMSKCSIRTYIFRKEEKGILKITTVELN